ncbi:MAG: VWA domain-containing protein [Mariprofundaceae bacterium]|nr:VWA domain-containing protein [Mariprofundaceae bacterium]
MFEFVSPWLLLLLPLPWLVWRLAPEKKKTISSGLYIPFADDLQLVTPAQHAIMPQRWLLWIAVIAWCLLVLAVARPQWLGEAVELSRSGRDVMLAVDLSGSMKVKDFTLKGQQVNRLTAIQSLAGAFIDRREGDRIGLILFGSQAYLQSPLTFDRTTVQIFLQEAVIGLAGENTAIGDAIGLAVKRLKDTINNTDLVMILLTDGMNTSGELSPEEGIQLAKEIGLRIHSIGMGATSMQVPSFFGSQTINPSRDLDEEMLQRIASETGGQYFRARDSQELERIYTLIDQLEPVQREQEMFRPVQALMMYPLSLAILLGFCLLWLRAR